MRRKGAKSPAQWAARQHGVVTTAQLALAGMDSAAITRAIEAGRLHRLHRGYAVGHHSLAHRGRWLAAVLACGPGATLSHTDAARLWRLLPLERHPGPVEVTVAATGGRRRRQGIALHRSRTLARAEITRRHGIPVTRPARTIADLRRVVARERVEDAIDRARFLGLAVGSVAEPPTRSRLERRFLALCRRHRLPVPEVNAWIGADRVDFLWRTERLVVETDGWEVHRTRAAFEADRARDARLRLAGYEVVRVTDRQLREEPERVAATVRALLTHRR